MAKEVRIQLTPEQKAKIKAATGKTMGEIRVTSLGNNLAVSPSQRTTSVGAQDMSIGARDMSVGAQDMSIGARDMSSKDLSSKDLSSKDLSAKDLRR